MTESLDRSSDPCSKVRDLVPLFFDGELSVPEVELVSLHTTRCAPCEREMARLDRLHILLKGAIEERADAIDPQRLWCQIEGRLWSRPQGWRSRLASWWSEVETGFGLSWPMVAAVAMTLLAVALFFRWGDLRGGRSSGTLVAYEPVDWVDVPAQIQQIESDSPLVTVVNDARSSAAVIWVSDEQIIGGGQVP